MPALSGWLPAGCCRALSQVENRRWNCTAARARMAGLPGSLEGAANAMRLAIRKDKSGKNLIRALCMPDKDGKFNDDPDLMRQFALYAALDVATMRGTAPRAAGTAAL